MDDPEATRQEHSCLQQAGEMTIVTENYEKLLCVYYGECKNGTIYIGVTNNLLRRAIEHKRKEVKGFTEKYRVDKLIWYEQTNDIRIAIEREKQLKGWNRK